jgi:hypothetical protein
MRYPRRRYYIHGTSSDTETKHAASFLGCLGFEAVAERSVLYISPSVI